MQSALPNREAVLLVVNPISGSGRAIACLEQVTEALRRRGIRPSVLRTTAPGDARRAAAEFDAPRGTILSFGGDGTFNEVLNGADLTRCTLGMIPAGAGNVLAKEVGISWRPATAIEQLLDGRPVRLDVGVCNGRRFASVVGAGLDAAVVEAVTEKRTGRMGKISYVPSLVRTSLTPQQWKLTAELDGRVFERGAGIVTVGNTHSYGGPMELTPLASATDGRLDVMATRFGGPTDMLAPGLAVLLRKTHLPSNARYGRGKRVRITSPGKVPYQLDGEFGGYLPVEIECRPGALSLLVPPGCRPGR